MTQLNSHPKQEKDCHRGDDACSEFPSSLTRIQGCNVFLRMFSRIWKTHDTNKSKGINGGQVFKEYKLDTEEIHDAKASHRHMTDQNKRHARNTLGILISF